MDIGLESCWGRGAGDESEEEGKGEGELRCMFLQIRVLENHQNGKDTHIRGVQIWARDEREGRGPRAIDKVVQSKAVEGKTEVEALYDEEDDWLEGDIGDWEIR